MRLLRHSFTVDADIDRVWKFYTDIGHLQVITPPEMGLKVERSTAGSRIEQGSEVWISAKILWPARSKWRSKITHMSQYGYVDEMATRGGLFKSWKHTHTFRKAAGGGSGTEIIDEIEFELPYGPLGRMFEGYALRRLEKIFEHREKATAAALR